MASNMRTVPKRILARDSSSTISSICRSCQRRRQFTTSPPRPPAAGFAELPSRRLLSVAGPDSAKFLQGIITANVSTSTGETKTEGFYSGFLNATGRVLHDVFIYPVPNENAEDGPAFLIEADASQLVRLEKFIKRYKLRAKVKVRSLGSDEASVWQAWNDSADTTPTQTGSNIVLRDPRAPSLGYRLIQRNGNAPEIDLDRSTEDAYTIRRYLQGVPEGQEELLREHSLPLDSNMEYMNGIDFHKGCYVGQELTIRTKHRGVVRKRILPCMIYEKDKAEPQTLQYEPDCGSQEDAAAQMIPTETGIGRWEKRGRSAGKWLKGVGNIGLGLCRLEIMTDIVLPGEQAAATYKPGDEFLLDWGEEGAKTSVKVKAFVPDWLRQGLDGQK